MNLKRKPKLGSNLEYDIREGPSGITGTGVGCDKPSTRLLSFAIISQPEINHSIFGNHTQPSSRFITMASPVMWLYDVIDWITTACQVSIYYTSTIIQSHKRVFIALQACHFGLIIANMALATYYPHLHYNAIKNAEAELEASPIGRFAKEAYTSRNLVRATLVTFAVNLVLGTFIIVTLPSLIIPFSGIIMVAYRDVLWGWIFVPRISKVTIPHLFTLLLEGEAYVFAALGSWIHGREIIRDVLIKCSETDSESRTRAAQVSVTDTARESRQWLSSTVLSWESSLWPPCGKRTR